MLNLCQALVLLVVSVASQGNVRGTRPTSEAAASAYVKPDLPLIESVNFFYWSVSCWSSRLVGVRLACLVEEVPSATQLAFRRYKPTCEHLPLEILLVVHEHFVGLRYNPDLPVSVPNILVRVDFQRTSASSLMFTG